MSSIVNIKKKKERFIGYNNELPVLAVENVLLRQVDREITFCRAEEKCISVWGWQNHKKSKGYPSIGKPVQVWIVVMVCLFVLG